jgi:hypothetical protein
MMNIIMLEPIDGVLRADIGNYVVWSDGRVWSKSRKNFMRISISNRGYCHVKIDGGKRSLHRIVARTFIPNPDNLPLIDHINNNKTDNRVENLRWCTPHQNMQWAEEDGLVKHIGPLNPTKGIDSHLSKLSESDVLYIYNNPDNYKKVKLAKIFNVTHSNICSIQKGRAWSWLTGHKKA